MDNKQMIIQYTAKFRYRLTWSVKYRIDNAPLTDEQAVGSEYTVKMARLYAKLNVEEHVNWILAGISIEAQAVCGQPITDGRELLDIPPPSNESKLKQLLCYIGLPVDENGDVLDVYSGSGTGRSSVLYGKTRLIQYDDIKADANDGHISATNMKSRYLQTWLRKDVKLHIRPLFFVNPAESSADRVVGVEGHFTDIFNTLDVEAPCENMHRTKVSIAAFPDAVPPDMREVSYGKANRAHQLAQGSKGKNPPCSRIGMECTHDPKDLSILTYVLDGRLIYGCNTFYASFKSYRSTRRHLTLAELIPPFLEQWTFRGATGKHSDIRPEDRICTICGKPEGVCRGFLGRTSRIQCEDCYMRFVGKTGGLDWRQGHQDASDDEANEVWRMFTDAASKAVAALAATRDHFKNMKKDGCCVPGCVSKSEIGTVPDDFMPNDVLPTRGLCNYCNQTWVKLGKPSSWTNFAAIRLKSSNELTFRRAQIECVCSTEDNTVYGTKVVETTPWAPLVKMCVDCHKVWSRHRSARISMQPYQVRWSLANPCNTLEEFKRSCLEY